MNTISIPTRFPLIPSNFRGYQIDFDGNFFDFNGPYSKISRFARLDWVGATGGWSVIKLYESSLSLLDDVIADLSSFVYESPYSWVECEIYLNPVTLSLDFVNMDSGKSVLTFYALNNDVLTELAPESPIKPEVLNNLSVTTAIHDIGVKLLL